MIEGNQIITVWTGHYLSMVMRDQWEYVTRHTGKRAVGIGAVTDAGQVVLVEQYRTPVGQRVVELPAGLAGDIPGSDEISTMAARENVHRYRLRGMIARMATWQLPSCNKSC